MNVTDLVIGWNNGPNPQNLWMLPYMEKVTFKDFEMERLAWIIQVGPNYNHKCSYKRKQEGDLIIGVKVTWQSRRIWGGCAAGVDDGGMGHEPTNARNATLEVGKGKEEDSFQNL